MFDEADKVDNFWPTYKKVEYFPPFFLFFFSFLRLLTVGQQFEGHPTPDYGDPQWPQTIYRIEYKVPWYKSGRVEQRIPGIGCSERLPYCCWYCARLDFVPFLILFVCLFVVYFCYRSLFVFLKHYFYRVRDLAVALFHDARSCLRRILRPDSLPLFGKPTGRLVSGDGVLRER